jgi:4-amino-4-deoxy-L-arabinose transferase-like glycosyltransferase
MMVPMSLQSHPTTRGSVTRARTGRYPEIALLILCLFLFFFNLGKARIFDLDEALYVTCARNMAVKGNWVTPLLNSRPMLRPTQTMAPFYEKPILVYWCSAACMKLFGVSEFAARIPAALSSLIATGFVWYAGRKWFSRRAGLIAAAVYATAPMTVLDARQMTTDSLLVCWLTGAMIAFWQSRANEPPAPVRRKYVLLFWVFCALAVLTKGAVGLLLPFMIIVVNVIFEKLRFRFRWAGRAPGEIAIGARWYRVANVKPVLFRLMPLLGLLMIALIAAPWHLAILQTHAVDAEGRNWIQEYVVRQHIGRFKGGDTVHNAPVYTYVLYFLVGFFPWACFAPTAFRNPDFEGSRPDAAQSDIPGDGEPIAFPWPNIQHSSRPEDDRHRYLLVWFWTIFTFFSISAAKLPTYIVPAFPAAALLVGRWFDLCLKDATRFRAMLRAVRGVVTVSLLLSLVSVLLPAFVKPNKMPPTEVVSVVRMVCITLLVGSLAAWVAMRNGEVATWRRFGIASLVLSMSAVVAAASTLGFAVAAKDLQEPYQSMAVAARVDASHGIPVVYYGISPRLPSMLYYGAEYSPIERKEKGLGAYLNSLKGSSAEVGPAGVDVVMPQKADNAPFDAELKQQGWSKTPIQQTSTYILYRLSH